MNLFFPGLHHGALMLFVMLVEHGKLFDGSSRVFETTVPARVKSF